MNVPSISERERRFEAVAAEWRRIAADARRPNEIRFSALKREADAIIDAGQWVSGPADMLSVLGRQRDELVRRLEDEQDLAAARDALADSQNAVSIPWATVDSDLDLSARKSGWLQYELRILPTAVRELRRLTKPTVVRSATHP